jgi:RecQ zinc-binding
MFHSSSDINAHMSLIENPTKNKRNGAQPVSEETKAEQKRLLQKTCAFVTSFQCRRVELLKYLEAEEDEYKRLIINDECCDNCKRVLSGESGKGIPAKILYEGVLDDGTVDCTVNIRLLLESIREVTQTNGAIDHLIGQILPFPVVGCGLKSFGVGRSYSRAYWEALLMLIHQKDYIDEQNYSLNKKAKTFLRHRSIKEFVVPVLAILQTMQKRKNLIFFWENNEIKSRPKTNDEMFSDKYGIPASVQQDLTKEEANQIELLLSDVMMDVEGENEDEIIQKTMKGLTEADFIDLTMDNEEDIVNKTMSGLTENDFIDLVSDEEEVLNPPKKQRLEFETI